MKTRKSSGIQKKYLRHTLALLILALLLSSIGVWVYVRKNMTSVIVDKYEFMNEKMGISLDNLYKKSDEVTAECITDDSVQKSLRTKGLENVEKNALSKYFAYIDLDDIAEYCYVDNKENVYTKSYSNITYADFKESGFEERLEGSYARTQWFFTEDTLFGTGKEALFVGRMVRSMDYAHEPGMIFFKMNEHFLKNLVEDRDVMAETAVGIIDSSGNFCMQRYPEWFSMSKTDQEEIISLAESEKSEIISSGRRMQGGILQAYRQKESGLTIFTIVPNSVLGKGLSQILTVLIGIYALVMLIAVGISLYFSRVFTRPIQKISEEMENFDGKDFSHKLDIHTDTELDKIGHSYNEMLANIEQLVEEIKKQEKELRTSELHVLINQINPHFLYNTLDTIYMLARINGEEKTMKMIHALSSYLRLSLSKGSDIVTVADELENVKSYMEIQQIRNADLFRYEIDCQVDASERWILKLILQPLVENAIKHGFDDIFEGGLIRIEVKEVEGRLSMTVYNNGTPMMQEMVDKINALGKTPIVDLKNCFADREHGYGIINIMTRLRLKYGEGVKFEYEVQKDGTKCHILLPGDGKENHEL